METILLILLVLSCLFLGLGLTSMALAAFSMSKEKLKEPDTNIGAIMNIPHIFLRDWYRKDRQWVCSLVRIGFLGFFIFFLTFLAIYLSFM